MINLKASRKTGTINVGVNPVTNINVAGNPSTPTTVRYPPINEGTIPPAPGSEFVSVAPQAVRLSSDEHTSAVSSFTANIPTSDNRSKGDMTYYQRQALDPGTFQLDEDQLDLLCYPNKQELSFVESTAKLTETNYFSFLDSRRNNIANRFINSLYK